MNYKNYGNRNVNVPKVQMNSQQEKIPGTNQELNNTGAGFSYVLDDMKRFLRFLILGSAGGTYYVSESKLTKDNLDCLERLIKAGRGKEAIDLIEDVSWSGRAPKNDEALFALAYCASSNVFGRITRTVSPEKKQYTLSRNNHADLFQKFPVEGETKVIGKKNMVRYGDFIYATPVAPKNSPKTVDELDPRDVEIRQYALSKLPRVARTGTHRLHFVDYVQKFRGWGPSLRKALAKQYEELSADHVAGQVTKYQQRDGFSQRDVLRLSHPKSNDKQHNAIYHWLTKGWESIGDDPHPDAALNRIWAYEKAKRSTSVNEIVDLIINHRLPREGVPTQFLNEVAVWEALMQTMMPEAMMRNLAKMTSVGLLTTTSAATKEVVKRLNDMDAIRKARLHPIKILAALKTYESGHAGKGNSSWNPVTKVTNALDEAFYLSFGAVTPTGKHLVLALDVSGSMSSGDLAGVNGLSPRVASSAMAMVTARAEENYTTMAFSRGFIPLNISPRQRLDDICRMTEGLPFDSTDCARPMLWALEHGVKADGFVVLTDNETYAGRHIHPSQALQQYRQVTGIPAKLIVVGMTSTQFTIADPNDAGSLDVVGFDVATPEIISGFVRGEF